MNFRKLLTYLAVGTAAVIPFAGAQNPTILQGSYISNVFGQSNFILNPNAQTNVANVTVSSATVTRSTTTPLVATSEFNITTSTATGYADWATRTFDAGMKNQNCEARFTYRGFSVGSTTVQIRQGSNTVAQLTLTASTDPRIASINFPCGDLSSATTLRVQQATASLTGTNELSGLYLGLATNQANVAQAEFVGGGEWNAVVFSRSSAAIQSTFAAFTSGSAGTAVGKATSAGSDSTITFSYLPAGQYHVSLNLYAYGYALNSSFVDCQFSIQEIDSNTYSGLASTGAYPNIVDKYPAAGQLQGNFTFSTAGQRRFRIVSKNAAANGASSQCNVLNESAMKAGIYVYRFPTSSELVVTPERQNWYVNAYQGDSGSYPSLGLTTVASFSEITNAAVPMIPETNSQPVAALCASGTSPSALSTSSTNCGATNESLGIAFAIPTPGQYEVCAEFAHAPQQSASGSADVYFQLAETNLNNTTVLQSYTAANNGAQAGTSLAYQSNINMCRIFSFSSVGTKGVRLLYKQTISGTVTGNVIAMDVNLNRALRWKIQPVTNQSNSALYVQGPVLGAQTGAAIPAGYVGETISELGTTDLTINTTSGGTSTTLLTKSIPVGVWMLIPAMHCKENSGFTGEVRAGIKITTSNTDTWGINLAITDGQVGLTIPNFSGTAAEFSQDVSGIPLFVNLTSPTTYYMRGTTYNNTLTGSVLCRAILKGVRLN